MQVLKPMRLGILCIIMLVGVVALTTELIEFEEIAKMVVIPSLVLLVALTGYLVFQTHTYNELR
jgi:tryptophan-rich sensory protein